MNMRKFIARHKRALVVLSSLLVCGAGMFVGFMLLVGVAISGFGEAISPVIETLEPREIEIRLNSDNELFSEAINFSAVSYSFWQSRDTYVRFSLPPMKLETLLTELDLEVPLRQRVNPFPDGLAAEALEEWWNPEQAEVFSGGSHSLGLQSAVHIFVDQTDPALWIAYLAIFED